MKRIKAFVLACVVLFGLFSYSDAALAADPPQTMQDYCPNCRKNTTFRLDYRNGIYVTYVCTNCGVYYITTDWFG
ncbi:hypothetical protein NDGK_02349 [Clostridiales bacterium CHKCI001]|nr:hypothetical protein NDGK_02349 [Clostridiales bacterium CHKCI001]